MYRVRWGVPIGRARSTFEAKRVFQENTMMRPTPHQGFAALMVCGEADAGVPVRQGGDEADFHALFRPEDFRRYRRLKRPNTPNAATTWCGLMLSAVDAGSPAFGYGFSRPGGGGGDGLIALTSSSVAIARRVSWEATWSSPVTVRSVTGCLDADAGNDYFHDQAEIDGSCPIAVRRSVVPHRDDHFAGPREGATQMRQQPQVCENLR